MRIDEVLTTPVNYKWVEEYPTFYQALFVINTKEYTVTFQHWMEDEDESIPEHWDIEFALMPEKSDDYSRHDTTGTGDALAVFSAVQRICRDWFRRIEPECVTMSAANSSRRNIYTKLLRSFLPTWHIRVSRTLITAMSPTLAPLN